MATLGTGGPKESTEWDDILRSKGIIPEKTVDELANDVLKTMVEEKVENFDPHSSKSVAQLNEDLEDADSDEEEILSQYRERRMQEMRALALKRKFGPGVEYIPANEWKAQVTEAGDDTFVIVHLFQPTLEGCKLMDQLLLALSSRFLYTKFVRARATDAIPNYPDTKCPTILVYKGGKVIRQFVGLDAFAGQKTDEKDLEWALSKTGAVTTEMLDKPSKSGKEFKLNFSRVQG
eukprot:Plantae.Rhodophyta-Palmaria_palmata.ctg8404.p1 GENE.Plantae.Rhodophyta-Palmaria_palmata.ctg8404~~Plantae.Rhodophyta-Palmaria_palmata.ctg8404.p1  ORF type:complete len:234 (-),score=46.65 Plantae.Rhodophyta-Palmaria_palmata.ctg8404:103-804(-)